MPRPLALSTADWCWDWTKRLVPLLLLLALAGASYWLVKRTSWSEPSAPSAKSHAPDYFVDKLSASALDDKGQTKYRMTAQRVVHYEDDESAEVTRPAVRAFPSAQQANPSMTTVTADKGILSGDASTLDLLGHAEIVRPAGPNAAQQPAMRAFSSAFRVWLNQDRVTTEQPVTLEHGSSTMTAQGMVYEHVPRAVQLLGQVRGTLAAQPARTN